jgi:GH25 family lysozyme M1 (1,4-beta-N-acetylmuramidase)
VIPPPRLHPRTGDPGRRRTHRCAVTALAALTLAAAPLAAAGPAAAASAGSVPAHPSLGYLKAHARYDHMGWELSPRRATRPPAPAAVPLLAGVLGEQAASSLLSPAASSEVLGLDVASGQGDVSWSTVAADGAQFAYVKATEGSYYVNPYFAQQYDGSYSAGLIRGAYEFANPSYSSGTTQADYFVAHGGGWSADGKTLPGVLDIEYNPYGAECYGLSQPAMVSWIKAFVNTYHAKTGRWAVIYSTTDWWTTCTGNNGGFGSDDPLWLARYASSPGTLPAGWSFYTIWQYADSGTFPGDQDVFNGTSARLRALALNT